jgi:SAM-dependent methyltransferase
MDDAAAFMNANRALWNRRVEFHRDSELYGVAEWKRGADSLNSYELELLGDVGGKDLLHLQCHFGQDTLSLARRGARVTGVDFAGDAITLARSLATELGLDAQFVEANVYDLATESSPLRGRTFDLVFASYGVIGWLPDLAPWGRIIANALKPGGRFVFVEFHPIVWMFDDDFTGMRYSYFRRAVIATQQSGSYAAPGAPIHATEYGWNHSLSEVLTALLDAGLVLESFREHEDSPYSCFSGMVEHSPGRYRIAKLDDVAPLVYSLAARKP